MRLRKKKSLLDQASDYVDAVRPQVESAVSTAVDAIEDFYESTARPALRDARDKAGPALADARDKAAPYVAEARDRATDALTTARDNAGPALADARDKAAPYAAQARDRAADVAAQAKEAADARVAQVRGEKPKKSHKLRKVVIFAAIAGAIGFVAKKLQGGGQSDNWQSSYVPTPAPSPSSTSTSSTSSTSTGSHRATDPADDGGSAPDEAISDESETPHAATTPDAPADVVDVDETDKN